jgi:hypothetical protein
MGGLFRILDFLLERPPLTGALVWGALYLIKRKRTAHMTPEERQHTLDLYRSQRPYAERMYDPPTEEEQSASLNSERKG